jgi:hypothetical protein
MSMLYYELQCVFLPSGPMATGTSQRRNTSIQERRGFFGRDMNTFFRTKNRQNRKFYNRLTTKDMLRVFMGSSRTSSQLRGRQYTGPPSTITEGRVAGDSLGFASNAFGVWPFIGFRDSAPKAHYQNSLGQAKAGFGPKRSPR